MCAFSLIYTDDPIKLSANQFTYRSYVPTHTRAAGRAVCRWFDISTRSNRFFQSSACAPPFFFSCGLVTERNLSVSRYCLSCGCGGDTRWERGFFCV